MSRLEPVSLQVSVTLTDIIQVSKYLCWFLLQTGYDLWDQGHEEVRVISKCRDGSGSSEIDELGKFEQKIESKGIEDRNKASELRSLWFLPSFTPFMHRIDECRVVEDVANVLVFLQTDYWTANFFITYTVQLLPNPFYETDYSSAIGSGRLTKPSPRGFESTNMFMFQAPYGGESNQFDGRSTSTSFSKGWIGNGETVDGGASWRRGHRGGGRRSLLLKSEDLSSSASKTLTFFGVVGSAGFDCLFL